MNTDDTKVNHQLEWGRWIIWKKGSWAFQISFPTVQWKLHKRELWIDFTTAFRMNFQERAIGFELLGWGLGLTLSPDYYKEFRNDGLCHHGVSLKRTCAECKVWQQEKEERLKAKGTT